MPGSQIGFEIVVRVKRANHAPIALATKLIVLTALTLLALSCGSGGGGTDPSPPPPTITVSVSPTMATVVADATQQFTATVTGTSNTAVTWSVNGVAGGNSTLGTVSASGLYTAPATLPSPNPVTVTATSQASASQSASAVVSITMTVTLTVAPTSATLAAGTTEQFTATVTGTSNTSVTWSVNGTAGGNSTVGTISASGLYTAPATVPSPNSVSITAISQVGSIQSNTVSVTITTAAPVTVTVAPTLAPLLASGTQQFTATVAGPANTNVTWSVNGTPGGNSSIGTISSSGLFTAPGTMPAGSAAVVTATSQANPTYSAASEVTFIGANSTVPGGLLTLAPAQSLGNADLTNPGFESGAADWTLGSCFAIDNTTAHSGSNSLKFTAGSGCSSFPDFTGQVLTRGPGAVQSYSLQGWVMGTAGTDITVKLSVHDVTRGGDVVGETSVVAPGTSWQQLNQVDIDLLPPLEGDTLEVEGVVTAGTTGAVWFDDIQLIEQPPPTMSAFLKYPNFRGYLWANGPQSIELETEVPNPAGMTIQATLQSEQDGSIIQTLNEPAATTLELDFNELGGLALGSYLVQASLLNSSSQVVATYPAYRVTKVSAAFKASLLNYIDTDNFLVTNGQKVFVWGAYDRWSTHRCNQCLFTNEAGYLAVPGFNNLSTFQSYQATDLNAEMNITPGAGVNATPSDNQMLPWLQADNSVGVGHLQIMNNWVEGNPARPIWANSLTDVQLWQLAASSMNGVPGALGYYPYDEPTPNLVPQVFTQYQILAPGNPGSITFGTLGDPSRIFRWRDASDVLSSDPYPVGVVADTLDAAYGATISPPMMDTWIETYWTEQQVYGSRPVWMVLQLYDLNGDFPTYEQMKQQAYNAIINHATGIMWWGYVSQQGLEYEWYVVGGTAGDQHYFDFQQISSEVMTLEPFLILPAQQNLVQSVSNTSNIQYLVKANSSQIVIFTSNVSQNALGNVTFTLPSAVVPSGSTVQVYSESRTLPLTTNTFTDSFAAYDVHVYIVTTLLQ